MPSANVIVANDLRSGRVVYLDSCSNWQPRFDNAQLFTTQEGLDDAIAVAREAEQRNQVVAPEPIELDAEQQPQHYREQIRSQGPGCLAEAPAWRRSA